MPHVVVIGAGPAGLAAAEALLTEGGPGMRVTLATVGHHLGGKACSWREDDRVVEHGQHVMLGFYDELRALLRRSGVEPDDTSVSNRGRFVVWEDRDRAAHDLHLGPSSPGTLVEGLRYTGWTIGEKAGFAAMFARVLPRIAALGVPESLDDVCMTAWCLEKGLPMSALRTNMFRASREAQLNWPGEISAYSMLSTLRVVGRDFGTAEARFPAGGMTEIWWEPIARRIERLGGEVVKYRKLVGLRHAAGRLTGLVMAFPMPHETPFGHQASVPVAPGTEEVWEDLDAAIVTIPAASFAEVLDPELAALPGLNGIDKLTGIAPLALHVWHRTRATPKHHTVVCGLQPPLGFCVDNKAHYPLYASNDDIGAALHFVGQETAFEDDDDLAILDRALASIRPIPGYEGMDREGVIAWRVVRNRGPHQRYWNAEPGSLKHKPQPVTPLDGLLLAGDWVRSELDFPCMETAVRSGRHAARLALRRVARRAA